MQPDARTYAGQYRLWKLPRALAAAHLAEARRGKLDQTNPIYFDEQSALAQGWPALPAPPTFSFCLKQLAGQPYSYLREMGVDIASLLHGEQAFEYAAPIHAGDTITLNTGTETILGQALISLARRANEC